jgi:hypothetical protein
MIDVADDLDPATPMPFLDDDVVRHMGALSTKKGADRTSVDAPSAGEAKLRPQRGARLLRVSVQRYSKNRRKDCQW